MDEQKGIGGKRPGTGGKREGAGRKLGTPNSDAAPTAAIAEHAENLPERPRKRTHTEGMKGAADRAQRAADEYVEAAVFGPARLAGLVLGEDGKPEGAAASERVRAKCLELVLERAAGKALQPIGGEDGGPLTVVIRKFKPHE
jgi:hypothetical protein